MSEENLNFSTIVTPNNFQYSALDIDLPATEYTLVNLLVDQTGSVYDFKSQLEACMKTVVDSCKKHPRSQNLLMRCAAFNSTYTSNNIKEINGFNIVDNIDTSIYKLNPEGYTPLYDATMDSIETLENYAKSLNDQDYFCNGILFVITDGEENSSKIATMSKIKNAVQSVRTNESLESIKMILIGVNDNDSSLKRKLESFKEESGFDEYISMGDATPAKLAKLADWISRSVSSTSQALGTGGPSQTLSI